MSQPPEHTLTPVNQEALLPPEVAEAQVGEFLVTNQELFEEVHDRWSEVRQVVDDDFLPAMKQLIELGISMRAQVAGHQDQLLAVRMGANPNIATITARQARRKANRHLEDNAASMLYDVAEIAARIYRTDIQGQDRSDVEITRIVADGIQDDRDAHPRLPQVTEILQEKAGGTADQEDAETALAVSYAMGYQAQDAVVAATENLLSNDALVVPFISKVTELANDQDAGRQYLGLIESLATHIGEKRGADNFIRSALTRAMADPSWSRRNFVTRLIGDPTMLRQTRKNAIADVVGMQMLVAVITDDYDHPREDLIEKVAQRFENYGPLVHLYATFVKKETEDIWKPFRVALRPYEKDGRIPPKSNPKEYDDFEAFSKLSTPQAIERTMRQRADHSRELGTAVDGIRNI